MNEKRGYLSCALAFQKATGIRNIGRRYVMPGKLSLEQMETYVVRALHERFRITQARRTGERGLNIEPGKEAEALRVYYQMAKTLKHHNPELKDVRIDKKDLRQIFDFIRGVTSGINPQDIDYFINDYERHSAFAEKLEGLRARCVQVLGVELPRTWVPSPPTAERIENAIERKLRR